MNNSNKNEKSPKNLEISKMKKARRAAAAIFIGATGGALAVNALSSEEAPVKESNPVTTEAPASKNETITNEAELNELFSTKAGELIDALDADTSGNVVKTQLAPNGGYRGQGAFVQYSYIAERDGMTASVNVITMAGPNQDKPDPFSIAEFSAKLSTPGAVPPTDDNPLGNVDTYSVRYVTGEHSPILYGEADSVEFKIDQSSVNVNDPNMSAQLDAAWTALDSIQGFATQPTD